MGPKLKKIITITFVLVFCLAGVSNAILIDKGGGLIYDDVLDITWLQDVNYAKTSGYDSDGWMNWDTAITWVDSLIYEGYDDWRLPKTVDELVVWGYDGTTTAGYNITTSEIGYMFYENLGNSAYRATDGTYPSSGWGLVNYGPFENLGLLYWSDEYSTDPTHAWHNSFINGGQGIDLKNADRHFAWGVRDGDSNPIPEPTTMLLLGTGLIGLAGTRRKLKK